MIRFVIFEMGGGLEGSPVAGGEADGRLFE